MCNIINVLEASRGTIFKPAELLALWIIQKIFRVFQNPHVISATTRVNSFTIFCCPSFTADRIFVRRIDNSFVEQVDDPAMYPSLYGVLRSLGIQYKQGKSSDSLPAGMFKEVMNDLWLAKISSLSNEVALYVVLLEVLLFMPNSLIRHSK